MNQCEILHSVQWDFKNISGAYVGIIVLLTTLLYLPAQNSYLRLSVLASCLAYSSTLKTETINSSETLVSFYHSTTYCCTPDASTLNTSMPYHTTTTTTTTTTLLLPLLLLLLYYYYHYWCTFEWCFVVKCFPACMKVGRTDRYKKRRNACQFRDFLNAFRCYKFWSTWNNYPENKEYVQKT
jgi:hypothetical protein